MKINSLTTLEDFKGFLTFNQNTTFQGMTPTSLPKRRLLTKVRSS